MRREAHGRIVAIAHGRVNDCRVRQFVQPKVPMDQLHKGPVEIEGMDGDVGPHLGRDRGEVADVRPDIGEAPAGLEPLDEQPRDRGLVDIILDLRLLIEPGDAVIVVRAEGDVDAGVIQVREQARRDNGNVRVIPRCAGNQRCRGGACWRYGRPVRN